MCNSIPPTTVPCEGCFPNFQSPCGKLRRAPRRGGSWAAVLRKLSIVSAAWCSSVHRGAHRQVRPRSGAAGWPSGPPARRGDGGVHPREARSDALNGGWGGGLRRLDRQEFRVSRKARSVHTSIASGVWAERRGRVPDVVGLDEYQAWRILTKEGLTVMANPVANTRDAFLTVVHGSPLAGGVPASPRRHHHRHLGPQSLSANPVRW